MYRALPFRDHYENVSKRIQFLWRLGGLGWAGHPLFLPKCARLLRGSAYRIRCAGRDKVQCWFPRSIPRILAVGRLRIFDWRWFCIWTWVGFLFGFG